MYTFISNQDNILKSLIANIKGQQKLSIIDGMSGSGKTYVLENIVGKFAELQFFWLKGDPYTTQREYYPFYNLINQQYVICPAQLKKALKKQQFKEIAESAGSLSPIGDEMISKTIDKIVNNQKEKKTLHNCIFSSEELHVLFQLEYFCHENKHTIFLCDDVQYWDEKSIQLLYMIIKNPINGMSFINHACFIVSVTKISKAEELTASLYVLAGEKIYSLDTVKQENYSVVLKQLGLNIKLNPELVAALYSITGGNLQLSHDIVDLLNENQYPPEEAVENIVTEKQLGHRLIERLNHTSPGNQINETLKFASLFGNTFQYYELETILNKNEGDIRKILQEAENYSLIKKNSVSASFIHELIRRAYKEEIFIEKEKYYLRYSECIKILYPGNYFLIKESLYYAGEYEHAIEMGIMEYLQYLRNNQMKNWVDISEEEPLPHVREYLDNMTEAYCSFNAGKYKKCMEILDMIEDIYVPILLAEKYFLLSVTLSKWLDSESRKRARECLVPFLNKEYIDNQTELWERIVSVYIVACIHDNHRMEAEQFEKKLSDSISHRLIYDFDASCKLNILRRKASMIYDESKTFLLAKKSKDFFLNNFDKILDPLQYYMSATNYMAASIKTGKSNLLNEDIIKVLNLPLRYPYINFQRMEMPLNNIIIASYINQEFSAVIAANKLESILETYKSEETTSTIIESNIAVLYCIEGLFEKGLSILERINKKFETQSNLEFYYRYLITRNLCAVKFLFNREKSISILEALNDMPNLSYRRIFKIQTEALLKNMFKHRNSPDLSKNWYLESLEYPEKGEIPPCWKYYGKKYLFGELEFWSES